MCPQFILHHFAERFQDLLEYKKQYGHTVVPQHFSGYDNLGKWVQSQRKSYKHFRDGIQTSMNPEKVYKLTEIGFVWDAKYKIRKRLDADNESDEGEANSPRRKRTRCSVDDSLSEDDQRAYASYTKRFAL